MIIAHLADLHLGYRAYHRLAPGGLNARERDVSNAVRAAFDRVIELRPDLVLVAGDVFHTVRPSNAAIADAFRQFARLSALLEDVPIVVIAGNHDSPRAVETGSILRLLSEIPNVIPVDDEPRSVYLAPIQTSVLCMPHNALVAHERLAMVPDAQARTNVLMLHGTVTGAAADARLRYVSEYGGVLVEASEIRPELWDYVALGHYHIVTELAPNMWYAGGIERTSTNVWEEASGEKGFLTFDTTARRAEFHSVPTRPVVDLPRFSAADMSPAEVDERIERAVASVPDGIGGKIVRLVITDVPRELLRELDHRRIRQHRAEALHFHLDARRPEVRRLVGSAAPGQRRTLDEEMENFLLRHWKPTGAGIAVERLVSLAHRYLGEAERASSEEPLLDAEPFS